MLLMHQRAKRVNSMVIVQLPIWVSAILVLAFAFLVVRGRVSVITGIYAAMASWTMIVRFGPISHVWLLMAAMFASAFVYWWHDGMRVRLPKKDTWIIPLMVAWWAWLFVLQVVFYDGSNQAYEQFVSLVCYNIAPLLMLLLFAGKTSNLKRFAMAYAITMSIGGLVGLSLLSSRGISMLTVLQDPLLRNYGTGIQQWFVYAIGVANYHAFAYGFVASLIFVVTFIHQSRSRLAFLLYSLWLVYCVYFLFVSNSKQAMAGAGLAFILLESWFFLHSPTKKRSRVFAVVLAVVATAIVVVSVRPELVLRDSNSLGQTFNLIADRGYYWALGLSLFAESPIWGAGLAVGGGIGHNFFVNTLSGQGVVGLFFTMMFLVFWVKQSAIVILSGRGSKEQRMWAVVFVILGLFNLIASQASGSPISAWFLFWSAAVTWKLRYAMSRFASYPQNASSSHALSTMQTSAS